jgi:hypothetical protein
MNIKTEHSDAIINQVQLDLFEESGDSSASAEPIVFFGYKKDRFGVIGEPKLVYIDENRIKWTIAEDCVSGDRTVEMIAANKKTIHRAASPKLKATKRIAQNE